MDEAVDLKGKRVMIVDDVPANLKALSDALEPEGYRIIAAPDGATALRIVSEAKPDIILLDVMMPGLNGYETCRELKLDDATVAIPVIFITAQHEIEDLLKGFQAGAVDYLTKPFAAEEVLARVETHLKISALTKALRDKNHELRQEIVRRQRAESARDAADNQLAAIAQNASSQWGIAGIVGESEAISKVLADVQKLQQAPTSVLIAGESGTGKELIARALHFGGKRSKGPFIAVNCSAIPAELAESILFGHVRGSFTGATSARKGKFELAHRGTLFLDEIGDMPPELQVKILRVLEDRKIHPVGAQQSSEVDVRILAATNADFESKIAEGAFREDLYYRLARFVIPVPPLRDRPDDIPLLACHFITQFAEELGQDPEKASISANALKKLETYPFPGNIRELRNVIERAMLHAHDSTIEVGDLEFINLTGKHATPAAETCKEQSAPKDKEHLEAMVKSRSQSADGDEATILNHLKTHDTINNAQCRELLDIDRHRANYLLKKLCQYELLMQEGAGRWAVYRLVD